MHIELRRTGVTLRLLHEKYVLANLNASPYGYRKFVELRYFARTIYPPRWMNSLKEELAIGSFIDCVFAIASVD